MPTSNLQTLTDDLVDIFGDANAADADKNAALEKHSNKGDAGIRALATRLTGINEALSDSDINEIADAVADALANGSSTVKKSRKTEVKLCLEQRQNITPVIADLDKIIAGRGEKDKKIHMRAAAMACLRDLRKAEANDMDKTAPQAVQDFLDKLDHVKDDEEKVGDLLTRLEGFKSLRVTDDVGTSYPHEALQSIRAAILAAAGGDKQHALDQLLQKGLAGSSASEIASEGIPEDAESIPEVAAMDELLASELTEEEESAAAVERDRMESDAIQLEDAPIPVVDEEDELNLDELVRGLM